MLSLINPVIAQGMAATLERLRQPGGPGSSELAAILARRKAQVVLFRCAVARQSFLDWMALVAQLRPDQAQAGRFTPEEEAAVNAGWPGADTGGFGGQMAAVARGIASLTDPAAQDLWHDSLRELADVLDPALMTAALTPTRPAAPPDPAVDPAALSEPGLAEAIAGDTIGPIRADGLPGVSIVTCCMNRNENLLRVLPGWLAQPGISEVVIVDWSSDTPVARDLAAAGIADGRVRVVRVAGEPRWILSYAFNLGFRLARHAVILKADADIVLAPDFLHRNPLPEGALIAGNWREVDEDQAHVNGFFLVAKADLAKVGGFNEHITTYGWDDEDLYARLMLAGVRRMGVAPGSIRHLPHSDTARTGMQAADPGATTRDVLAQGVQFLIRRNRYIAATMPDWTGDAALLPFLVEALGPFGLVLRREGWVPSAVPEHVIAAANSYAWRELLSWRLGRAVLGLEGPALEAVLDRPDDQVSQIDVEIARRDPGRVMQGRGAYLLIGIDRGMMGDLSAGRWDDLVRVVARVRAAGLTPVLWLETGDLPPDAPAEIAGLPALPGWEALGAPDRLTDLALLTGAIPQGRDLNLILTRAALDSLSAAAPMLTRRRERLFIDVQHGLGNRLRAMASAAAIARATDRELVVVWQPDAHCDCRLGDLFDYPGAVETERFLARAQFRGMETYNYMSVEPGAQKDAPIRCATGRDVYIRSAFVLKHPASTWAAENAVLRSLVPVAEVRAKVDAVRSHSDLAVHVRMQGGAAYEHLPFERPDNWLPADHAAIAEARSNSHYARFLRRIDDLIAEDARLTLFLAADLPEIYTVFRDRYGDRLACVPRNLYDRSASQLQFALADALLLGRAPRLLGSTWSSFTELASRLTPMPQKVEMSGTDF